MKPSRTVSFAMGAITALVLGSGTAYAATGGKFILGKSNSASSTSTLSNSRGTALTLNSKSGTAPLKVNRSVKVANLNADLVDGKSSGAFALASGKTGTITGSAFYADFDGDGQADALVGAAVCPSGTLLTGGGGEDDTSDGLLWLSEPASSTGTGANDAWLVISTHAVPAGTADGTASNEIIAMAQCYNPKGAVIGRRLTVAPSKIDWAKNAAVAAQVTRKLAN